MHRDLQRLSRELAASLAGLDARQTQATPIDYPEKWSIQQIVEHLLNTYRGSTPAIESRIGKKSGTRAQPTMRQRFGQFMLLKLQHFPRNRVAPTAVSPTHPLTVRSGEELAAKVSAELRRFDEVTAEGERMFGDRRAVSHVILGPLSMDQWRRFHLLHGLHHVKQIRRIRWEHGFKA